MSDVEIYKASQNPARSGLSTPGNLDKPTGPTDYKLASWLDEVKGAADNSSKLVDANGEPLVVYHGTPLSFDTFENNSWFTTDPDDAGTYSTMSIPNKPFAPQEYPVFLKLSNPTVVQHYILKTDAASQLDKRKRDSGFIIEQQGRQHFVVKNPHQIKSATGNTMPQSSSATLT